MLRRATARGGDGCQEPPQCFLATLKCLGIRLVVDEHPAPSRPHQPRIAQDPQVLRDGTLSDAKLYDQCADAEGLVGDQAKDAQAHLDGEGLQKAGNVGKVFHGLDYISVR